MNYIEKVKEFHERFNQPILESAEIPTHDRCDLRVELIKEELRELHEAIEIRDMTEVKDALGDLMYVLCGTVLEFGLADSFEKIFEEIHRSNLSKACSTFEEARATVDKYHSLGVESYMVNHRGQDTFLVLRKSDNKLLKSINYSPAELTNL